MMSEAQQSSPLDATVLSTDNLPRPPSLPQPPTRPFNPFGAALSNGLSGGGMLKKTLELKAWVEYDISSYIKQLSTSPRERIRQMDSLRLHRPHPDKECKVLKLEDRRINLHSLEDIMYLCGGLTGARFEGVEIKSMMAWTKELERLWKDIDQVYKSLPSQITKENSPNSEQDEVSSKIAFFNDVCDQYLLIIQNVQSLVKSKQLALLESKSSSESGIDYFLEPVYIIIAFKRLI